MKFTKYMKVFAVLMTVACVFFTFMISQEVSAASSVALPAVSSNCYLEVCAPKTAYVYTSSSLSCRGTAVPYRAYSASVYSGDTIYIYSINSSVCYLSYPTSSGRKKGYCRTSDVIYASSAQLKAVSQASATVYKYSSGSTVYGTVAKGDQIWAVGTMKSSGRIAVIYEAKQGSRGYKFGYLDNATFFNKVVPKTTGSTTNTKTNSNNTTYTSSNNNSSTSKSSSTTNNSSSKNTTSTSVSGITGSSFYCKVTISKNLLQKPGTQFATVKFNTYSGWPGILNTSAMARIILTDGNGRVISDFTCKGGTTLRLGDNYSVYRVYVQSYNNAGSNAVSAANNFMNLGKSYKWTLTNAKNCTICTSK